MTIKKITTFAGLSMFVATLVFLSSPSALAAQNHPGKMGAMRHRAERIEDRLEKAVEAGKITAEQKSTIETKLKELKDWRATLKNLSPQQRRDALKQKREELVKWANDNNIPKNLLLPLPRKSHNHQR